MHEEIAELAREAEELARRLTVAPARLAGCRGTDATRAVTVELNGNGLVTTVDVARAWRDRVGAHGLGQAVLDAIRAAGTAHLERWATAVTEGPAPAPSPAPPPKPAPALAIADVFDLIEKAGKEAADIAGLHTATTTRHSPGRRVTATLTGKHVSAVDVDQAWLAQAHHTDIATAIRDAIRAAYAAARDHAAEVRAHSASVRLGELVADRAALLRAVGLG
jgi:DNA-binding protein YbaB